MSATVSADQTVQEWGNGLGVRITAPIAKAARFALGFTENMTLTTEKGRTDAKILVDNALKEIRDAHRYTEVGYEPPKKTVGAAPPDIAAKIAQYKDALQRISALAPQSSGGGLLG